MTQSLAVLLVTMMTTLPTADLVDDMDHAADAEFVGRQLVVSWSPDGVVAQVSEVEQSGGMTMVKGSDHSVVIGQGKLIDDYGGTITYLEMTPTTPWRLWDGYEVVDGEQTPGADDSHTVDVLEEGHLRARFVLDEASSIPLSSEIFGGNGSLYRYTALIEVGPRDSAPMIDMADMPPPEVREMAQDVALPASAGHYWRADSYVAAGGIQAFYTDGLFRFSVFELSRKTDGGSLADKPSVEMAGNGGYHRQYNPAAVTVLWRTADQSYVLIGDLPPDHLELVLIDLPVPNRANPLKRAWRWVFG